MGRLATFVLVAAVAATSVIATGADAEAFEFYDPPPPFSYDWLCGDPRIEPFGVNAGVHTEAVDCAAHWGFNLFDVDGWDPGRPATRAELAAVLSRLLDIAKEPDFGGPDHLFPDVQGHPYADEVARLSSLNVINGFVDGTFGPDMNVRRDQMSSMMMRLVTDSFRVPFPVVEIPFVDVPEDAAHRDNIARIYGRGITVGVTADTFNPAGNVTRAQMITFAARLLPYAHEQMLMHPEEVPVGSPAVPALSPDLPFRVDMGVPGDGFVRGPIYTPDGTLALDGENIDALTVANHYDIVWHAWDGMSKFTVEYAPEESGPYRSLRRAQNHCSGQGNERMCWTRFVPMGLVLPYPFPQQFEWDNEERNLWFRIVDEEDTVRHGPHGRRLFSTSRTFSGMEVDAYYLREDDSPVDGLNSADTFHLVLLGAPPVTTMTVEGPWYDGTLLSDDTVSLVTNSAGVGRLTVDIPDWVESDAAWVFTVAEGPETGMSVRAEFPVTGFGDAPPPPPPPDDDGPGPSDGFDEDGQSSPPAYLYFEDIATVEIIDRESGATVDQMASGGAYVLVFSLDEEGVVLHLTEPGESENGRYELVTDSDGLAYMNVDVPENISGFLPFNVSVPDYSYEGSIDFELL